jgi:hypothetical protein
MFLCSKLPCLGWRLAYFLQVFFAKMFAGPAQTYVLVLELRFLCHGSIGSVQATPSIIGTSKSQLMGSILCTKFTFQENLMHAKI